MTYSQLKEQLEKLTPEQLNKDISIYFTESDEWYSGNESNLFITDESDVLDENHPYITI